MDKGTQEEVEPEPVYSYAKKLETCRMFIKSKSVFSTLEPLKRIIDLKFVIPLEELADFRSRSQGSYGSVTWYYSPQDAKEYFDWLVGIVAGIHEVSPDVFEKAVEQLFAFLYHMRHYTSTDKDPFATPSIEGRLDNIWEQLADLRRQLEARDKNITDVVEKLHLLMKTYGPTLEEARKDYEAKARKISGDRKD